MANSSFNELISQYRKTLKEKLSSSRYEHSLSVSYMCVALAMTYGYDIKKAEIAGILHDCAKHFSDETLIEKCRERGIPLTPEEIRSPAVIHAKYGAWLAEHKYGVQDEDILSAIACHTTGKPDMSLLDKILYVADYIEPRRDKASNLPYIRELAFHDLDAAVYEISKGTLSYLKDNSVPVDPETEQVYEYYKNVFEAGRKEKKSGKKKERDKEPEKNQDKKSDKKNDKRSKERSGKRSDKKKEERSGKKSDIRSTEEKYGSGDDDDQTGDRGT